MNQPPPPTDLTILLVEDDPHVSKVEIRLLERAGFRVKLAETGTEGWRLAQDELPAAIILDGELPELDGFEICRRLKADARTRAIPVLFCSGRPNAESLAHAAGADDFLAKPAGVAQLVERLQILLQI